MPAISVELEAISSNRNTSTNQINAVRLVPGFANGIELVAVVSQVTSTVEEPQRYP
jgi:hypothetical protein